MIIVDATAAHMAAFYDGMPARTCRAWAVLDDAGQVVGLCGFYAHKDGNMLFTNITPELRRHPRAMIAVGWRVLAHLQRLRRPVYAACDETVEASARFLQHFGFARQPNGVFAWLT